MAVVPPGNKQIGSFSFNLLGSSPKSILVNGATGFAITKNLNNTATPTVPYNVNIGNYSLQLLTSAKNNVVVNSALGLAVVKYTPPTRLFIQSASGFAAVKNTTVTGTLAPLKNLGVGSFSLVSLTKGGASMILQSITGLALVQKYSARRESIIHSLYYGKNNPFLR